MCLPHQLGVSFDYLFVQGLGLDCTAIGWNNVEKKLITDSLNLRFYILAFNDISWLFSDASPVGGNRCHFGPALWCQSRVHAKVKKAWKK